MAEGWGELVLALEQHKGPWMDEVRQHLFCFVLCFRSYLCFTQPARVWHMLFIRQQPTYVPACMSALVEPLCLHCRTGSSVAALSPMLQAQWTLDM
jgi:hypothetical protein